MPLPHTHTLTRDTCSLPLLSVCSTEGAQPPHRTGGVPVYTFSSDCISCVALHHLPCSTTFCCMRALRWWCVRVASLLLGKPDGGSASSGCVVPSFQGAVPAHCITTVAGGWAVEMGRPDMGRWTTSGEGRRGAQETEVQCRHPWYLAVVLPCNPVRGRVMTIPVIILGLATSAHMYQ